MAKSEGRINRAQSDVHREPRDKSVTGASRGHGSDVGNETKADLKGTQLGGSRAEGAESMPHMGNKGHLGHAVAELHRQHPHKHNDHGPHHGTTTHIRHEPVGKVYR